jgi:hypothetical protein
LEEGQLTELRLVAAIAQVRPKPGIRHFGRGFLEADIASL